MYYWVIVLLENMTGLFPTHLYRRFISIARPLHRLKKKKTNPNRTFFWPSISNQRTYLTVHELRTDIYWEHTHHTPVTQLSLIYELILRQFSNDQPKKSGSHYCKQLEKKLFVIYFFDRNQKKKRKRNATLNPKQNKRQMWSDSMSSTPKKCLD